MPEMNDQTPRFGRILNSADALTVLPTLQHLFPACQLFACHIQFVKRDEHPR